MRIRPTGPVEISHLDWLALTHVSGLRREFVSSESAADVQAADLTPSKL
jgi:hypothetical protein